MRSQIILGVALALALLQGCGRKGPLTLPVPQTQPSAPQAQQPTPPEQQKPAAPSPQQGEAQ